MKANFVSTHARGKRQAPHHYPQDKRIRLTRLQLAGLGRAPHSNPTTPSAVHNFTISLWAFAFPREQVALQLDNVTLFTSVDEVGVGAK